MSPSFIIISASALWIIIGPSVYIGWFPNHDPGAIIRNIVRILIDYPGRGGYIHIRSGNPEMHSGVYIYLGIRFAGEKGTCD
jgi:hypothetical protein